MDQKVLDDIKAMGALFYTPEEVAQVVGISADEFNAAMLDNTTPIARAYWGGWYESSIPLRKGIVDLAKRGSSPAQTLAMRIIEQAEARRYYEQ